MEQVALSLQTTAVARCENAHDFDQFGRSAFNRYYYALFLVVRELLRQLEPRWERQAHAAIPPLLKGDVLKGLKGRGNRAFKLRDGDGTQLVLQARAATHELASTMLRGYSVRVTADYDPAIPIMRGEGDRFSLGSTNITEAHGWPEKARFHSQLILRAWRLPE
jgi:hypothetical protein